MRHWMVGICVAAGLLVATSTQAQTAWPDGPVRMLVGASPGGGTDAMARAVSDELGKALKQNLIVDNRPGASNTIAAAETVNSNDGRTILMGVVTAHAIAPHLLKLTYNSNKDLVPVAYVGAVPNVLCVNNQLGVNSVQELIQLAKKEPGKLNFASSGTGSTQHIAAVLFQNITGTRLTHVPYKGSGPALIDLIGGQVQLTFDTLPSVIGQIKSGKVKALAVLTDKRNPQLPDVPTLAEAGVAGMVMSAWYGVYMPSSAPKAVQQKLHDAVNQVLTLPAVQNRMATVGAEATPMSQAQFEQFHAAEYKRYGDIIQKNHISLE